MALETITIGDSQGETFASILPGLGMNCFRFQVTRDGKPIDVLWSDEEFAGGKGRPSGSGVPILFPFPGRIRDAEFDWNESRYCLTPNDGQGNAIHGFVLDRPWRVVQHSDRAVVGQFQASIDDASLLEHWPADFRITTTYELAGDSLRATYLFENPGEQPLPCGLGIHPYFCVPVGGDDVSQCRVQVPVSEHWQLDGLIPTGERKKISSSLNLQRGMKFGDMALDDVFGGIEFDGERCTTRIDDPRSGRCVLMTFNRAFQTCVVYNPPHRKAVCIEPYSCLPDPIRLTDEGVDAGLLVLQSGDGVEATIEISVT